jgi:hypothetical protein
MIQIGIVVVIAVTIGAVAFVEYSAQPGFCTNCHIMEPYYVSWATSSHSDVKCIECHYAPGIKAEAMGKLQAANQVVKYVTGAYGLQPWAEIDDAACLRSGCHTERKLEGVVEYQGVVFDHTQHLGELRRGKELRCTSCHSQIVQGDHIAVTETTCYLCHFKDEPEGQPVAGCVGCHPAPPRLSSPAGFVIDHPQYVEDLVSCISCHEEVVQGDGHAEESRCVNCHGEQERLEKFDDTDLLHRVHIAGRKIECEQCHTTITHGLQAFTPEALELDCTSCHRAAHEVQKRLYAGVGGHATESLPSAMHEARVTCNACHEVSKEIPGHGDVRAAGESSCLSCHGIRYVNILPAWQQEMERRIGVVEPVVRGARRVAGSAPVRSRAATDSLLRLAEENLDFVRLGKGAHNVEYADQLLRASVELVREAVRVGRLPYAVPRVDLGPPVRENTCLSCHLGVERSAVTFQGSRFDHEAHAMAGLECGQCHTSLEEHGGTTITALAQCDACHHPAVGGRNCAACHEGGGGAPSETLRTAQGDFSHAVHSPAAGLACGACHSGVGMSAAGTECTSCHVAHHDPARSCVSCHREGALDIHEAEDHGGCADCHDAPIDQIERWTRQVCLACHADQQRHNVGEECVDCHRVPALGGAEGEALRVDPAREATAVHGPGRR